MNILISNILDDILGSHSCYINYDAFIFQLSDNLKYIIDTLITIINDSNYPNNVHFRYNKRDDMDQRLNLFNYLNDHAHYLSGLNIYKFDFINNNMLVYKFDQIILTLGRAVNPCCIYSDDSNCGIGRKTIAQSLAKNIMIHIDQDNKFHSKHKIYIDESR